MRAGAAELIDGEAVGLVVEAEAHDAVPEGVAMLLGSMHDREQLFVLNMAASDRVSSHLRPVEHPFVKVAPAELPGGITFQCDDRELLI